MDIANISPAVLDRALNALRRQGKTVQPLHDRLGYYIVDDHVKDAGSIVDESRTKH